MSGSAGVGRDVELQRAKEPKCAARFESVGPSPFGGRSFAFALVHTGSGIS